MRALQLKPTVNADLSAEDIFHFHCVATFGFGHAISGARKFDGDMTAWFVYWAFVVAYAADKLRSLRSNAATTAQVCGARLSAQSVSDMTGIPRQTVRRKCQELCDRGVLRPCDRSLYEFCPPAGEVKSIITPFVQMARRIR